MPLFSSSPPWEQFSPHARRFSPFPFPPRKEFHLVERAVFFFSPLSGRKVGRPAPLPLPFFPFPFLWGRRKHACMPPSSGPLVRGSLPPPGGKVSSAAVEGDLRSFFLFSFFFFFPLSLASSWQVEIPRVFLSSDRRSGQWGQFTSLSPFLSPPPLGRPELRGLLTFPGSFFFLFQSRHTLFSFLFFLLSFSFSGRKRSWVLLYRGN